jgi:Zn-dependent protease with chaperone function
MSQSWKRTNDDSVSAFNLIILATLLPVVTLFSGCAAQGPTFWRASGIAAMGQPNIRLLKDGQQFGVVERQTIVKLIEIKDEIGKQAGIYNVELVVATGDKPNAFATFHPKFGPVIGFNLPMINLFQYDWPAYAAIMGHEFAHLTLGHGADRKSREETRQGVSTVLGTLARLVIPMGGTLVDIASQAVTTIYTRDEERDADREGLEYARKAGYEPEGALRAWQMMLSATGGGISIPFLNTHPSSDERIATIKQSIAASKKTDVASSPRQPSPLVVASNSVQPVVPMPAGIDGVMVPPPIQVAQAGKTPVSSAVPGKARISITSEPLRGMTTDVSVNGKRIATVGPDNPFKGEISQASRSSR